MPAANIRNVAEGAAEVHSADRQGPACGRSERQGTRARLDDVVPLLLRRIGERQDHSAQRSQLGPPAGGGQAARSDSLAFLAIRDIFGALADNPTYVGAFSGALASLWTNGVRATLADYLSGKA